MMSAIADGIGGLRQQQLQIVGCLPSMRRERSKSLSFHRNATPLRKAFALEDSSLEQVSVGRTCQVERPHWQHCEDTVVERVATIHVWFGKHLLTRTEIHLEL